MSDTEQKARQLASAMAAFGRLSRMLSHSYLELQQRINHLARELAWARHERRRQRLEHQRLALELHRFIEALPGAFLVLDEREIVRRCNTAARDMLPGPLVGHPWPRIQARAFRDQDGQARLEDGRWISIASRPLEAPDNGRVLLLTDISAGWEAQRRHLAETQAGEVGRLSAALGQRMRVPLAAALMDLGRLEAPLGAEERRREVEKLRRRLHHMGRMIDNLLAFGRPRRSLREWIEPRGLIEALATIVEPQLTRRGGRLRWECRCDRRRLHGDQRELLNALVNLVENALQASRGVPHLELVAEAGHHHLWITLTDRGEGIPERLQGRIFEPFFTTRQSGAGLGLTVARSVVEAHGGRLRLDSRPGRGTCVTLILPLGRHTRDPASDSGATAKVIPFTGARRAPLRAPGPESA